MNEPVSLVEVLGPMVQQMGMLLSEIKERDEEIARLRLRVRNLEKLHVVAEPPGHPPDRYVRSTPEGGIRVTDKPETYTKATPGQA